jgi:hypothetical protein
LLSAPRPELNDTFELVSVFYLEYHGCIFLSRADFLVAYDLLLE